MFTVYVLHSIPYKKIYIGFTNNLDLRFRFHNEFARKGWTLRYHPLAILFTESYETKEQAMKREKELKSFRGREFIRLRISNLK